MITKSDLMIYRDAPLHFWAMKNDRIVPQPATTYQEFLRRQAAEVEALAEGFVEAMHPAPAKILSQVPFTSGLFHARTDYLVSRPDGLFDLYEVKSSTQVKNEHLIDAAFQALVVSDHHPLGRIFILHINNGYAKRGGLDPLGLFTAADVTAQVIELLPEADMLRQEAATVSRLRLDQVYDFATSAPILAGCTKPGNCPCPDLCFPPLPEYPIYQLPMLGKKAAELAARGVYALADIPDDFRLSETQRRHVRAAGDSPQVDLPAIRSFLDGLTFPLCFLDYETFPGGLPVLDGYRPYEHVVFQFSLQIVDRPGSDARSIDYLHREPTDPAPAVAEALFGAIGNTGSVIAWNMGFEKGRNTELAARVPEAAAFFADLNQRMVDLMEVFKKGYFVHRDFNGSASLKNVLPVIVPDMAYEDLSISQGDEAMLAWRAMVFDPLDEQQRSSIADDLSRYCRTDTEAMFRIWKFLAALSVQDSSFSVGDSP